MIVVMPAYNAGKTLEQTVGEIPMEYVDEIILVDDGSHDDTVSQAKALGLTTIVHPKNRGYGGNQKSCYQEALARGADIVVMLHPDYQYSPRLVPAMASMIASGHYDCVLGSRILSGGNPLDGGMPLYKYVANRVLTLMQNLLLGAKLSEYHTGYRAFSAELLRALPLHQNSDDFIFDNEMLLQILWFGFQIGEISAPTRYQEESSSIGFWRSVLYGLGVVGNTVKYVGAHLGLLQPGIFAQEATPIIPRQDA